MDEAEILTRDLAVTTAARVKALEEKTEAAFIQLQTGTIAALAGITVAMAQAANISPEGLIPHLRATSGGLMRMGMPPMGQMLLDGAIGTIAAMATHEGREAPSPSSH